MLETLDYTIRIGSTPTILYFDMYMSDESVVIRTPRRDLGKKSREARGVDNCPM